MSSYTEDVLAQQTTADYMCDELGWDSVYAHNTETFRPGGLLGRKSDREVVLTRYLLAALKEFNPGLRSRHWRACMIVDYSAIRNPPCLLIGQVCFTKKTGCRFLTILTGASSRSSALGIRFHQPEE